MLPWHLGSRIELDLKNNMTNVLDESTALAERWVTEGLDGQGDQVVRQKTGDSRLLCSDAPPV
jgi:hypothetical protein